jgi:hypothetical protein
MTGEWMSEEEQVKNLLGSEYWTQPETDFSFSDMQQKQIKEMQYMLSLVGLYGMMGTVRHLKHSYLINSILFVNFPFKV